MNLPLFCPENVCYNETQPNGVQKPPEDAGKVVCSMEFRELDSPDYRDIPIYEMGYGQPCLSPIVICRYNEQTHELGPLHRHKIFQINYIVRGQLTHRINNTEYPLTAGDLFVIPPYIPHQLVSRDEGGYEIVELEFMPLEVFGPGGGTEQKFAGSQFIYDFSYIEPFFVNERSVRPRLNLTGKAQIAAESLLDDMLQEFREQEDGYQLAMKADLSKLLVIASRAFHEEIKGRPEMQLFHHHRAAMSRTILYINEHSDEPLTIEDVSKMALLSQSYFSYLFKILTGKTFVEYLHDLRIKNAMTLLKTTDSRILDICYQCGFNSINHFNRTFKSAVGLSPRQYRELSRAAAGGEENPEERDD